MSAEPRFSENLDVLTALVTFLALTKRTSRTPGGIAVSLSLEKGKVLSVLDNFKGIFRKSRRTNAEGEHFYTLHMRYATRHLDDGDDDGEILPLASQHLESLLGFISSQVEREETRLIESKKNKLTLWAAIIAAGASIIGVVFTITLN